MRRSPLLEALQGTRKGHPPVWFMRQAGRYLPSFREMRKKYQFLEICRDPRLAAEVTILPLEFLDVDALVLFSDILFPLDGYELGLSYEQGMGPKFERPLSSPSEVSSLPLFNPKNFSCVGEAIGLVKDKSSLPVIGFAGGPFTLASYLIEGGSSDDLKKTKKWLRNDPKSFSELLERLVRDTLVYLRIQVEGGADVLQIFETWLSHLSRDHVTQFVLPYLKVLVDEVKKWDIPLLLFSRGGHTDLLASLLPDGLSVDHTADLDLLRTNFPNITLQGNLEPLALFVDRRSLLDEVEEILEKRKGDQRFIFNLGHGVLPETPIESLKAVVSCVKSFR